MTMFESKFSVGDHVYYVDNGPDDTGVVSEVRLVEETVHYAISWDDRSGEEGFYASSQLHFV